MIDGSEIRGGFHFKKHETHPFTFDAQDIQPVDWSGVTITQESKVEERANANRICAGPIP
jgi:hypothetical protein